MQNAKLSSEELNIKTHRSIELSKNLDGIWEYTNKKTEDTYIEKHL